MKSFRYKFTTLLKTLIICGMLLCVAGFALTTYYCAVNGIRNAADPVYPALQYVLMYLVSVGLFVLLVSVLANSSYSVDEKYFRTRFGLIVSKYDLQTVELITLDRKTNKLTVTFTSGEFIVIVVKQDWYEDFINCLLKANPKIEYTVISKENDGTDSKDK